MLRTSFWFFCLAATLVLLAAPTAGAEDPYRVSVTLAATDQVLTEDMTVEQRVIEAKLAVETTHEEFETSRRVYGLSNEETKAAKKAHELALKELKTAEKKQAKAKKAAERRMSRQMSVMSSTTTV